jgi:transcriptional regulator with GAF, ATPase, and Fis domain
METVDINFYKILFEDLDPQKLRRRFLERLLNIQKVERGSIWIRQGDRYVCIESYGGPARIDVIKGASISVKERSIVGWVMEHGKMTVAKAGQDPRHCQKFEKNMRLKSALILAIPLILRSGQVYGVVQIVDTSTDGNRLNLDTSYLQLLKSIVDVGAIALSNALQHTEQIEKTLELEQTLEEIRGRVQIIGQSPAFLKAMKRVRDYAGTDFPVLITGESGTGKDLVALALHNLSARRERPFVVQNCSAIPETLLESELFGYKKGAFTGATGSKIGLLMAADGGTVFLDEIGDMSLPLQARILRVIQNHEIKPLGESRTQTIDVRIVSATNKDLAEAVREKRFRDDLFYRLNVLPLHLPPLRDRRTDIALLLTYFIKRESLALGIAPKRLSAEALAYLEHCPWEGNIRELENFVRYLLSTVDDLTVTADHLPDHFKPAAPLPASPGVGTENDRGPIPPPAEPLPSTAGIPFCDYTWEALEKAYVEHLLHKNNWVVTRAAKDAGINRSTFDSRMKKLGIYK